MNETEREHCYAESAQFAHRAPRQRAISAAAPLHPTSTATSVRVRDGKRLVTDGPFAETREQLGGYYLIEAKDLDEAIGIAAGHSRRPIGHGRDPARGGDRRKTCLRRYPHSKIEET